MKTTKPLLLALTAIALGCSTTTTTEPEPVEAARVLVEIEYVNYAWGAVLFGFYVEGDGDVYKYDRKGAAWEPATKPSYTQAELNDKFSLNRTLVTKRDANEVASVAAKLSVLAGSPLSTPKLQCADAGILTYRGYKYDSASAKYTPVLLRVEGDYAQQNNSTTAQDLIKYVRSLGLIEELLGCDP